MPPNQPPASTVGQTIAPETDQRLVDTITYLASLASEAKAIDSQLDPMRLVTSHWDGARPLTEPERQTLRAVIASLKDHLINHDPLREFTAQTLDARLAKAKLSGPQPRRGLNFFLALLLSMMLAVPTVLLPSSDVPTWERAVFAVPFFLLCTTICNCWFYISSLRNFKAQLRRVFIFFCIGSVGLGLQFLHFVSIPLLGEAQNPLFKFGGVTLIAALSLAAIYIGLRMYARLLQLDSPFIRLGLVASVVALTTIVGLALPYAVDVPEKGYLGFSLASLLALSAFGLLSAAVARVILKSVTAAYAQSMKRLLIFTAGVFAGALVYATIIMVRGELSGRALSTALAICALPPMLLLLHSGYSFKKETSR